MITAFSYGFACGFVLGMIIWYCGNWHLPPFLEVLRWIKHYNRKIDHQSKLSGILSIYNLASMSSRHLNHLMNGITKQLLTN